MIRFAVVPLILLCLFSCAPKGTKVILLPQDGGSTGAVIIQNKEGISTTLDTPYTFVHAVKAAGEMAVQAADPNEIRKQYAGLFKAEFKRPVKALAPMPAPRHSPFHFTLFFKNDSIELTDESAARLPEFFALIKKHTPCDVSIVGYTDTKGKAERNKALSLKRANKVLDLFNPVKHTFRDIRIKGYGEYGLMFQTPDETPEPMNRRVTVTLH